MGVEVLQPPSRRRHTQAAIPPDTLRLSGYLCFQKDINWHMALISVSRPWSHHCCSSKTPHLAPEHPAKAIASAQVLSPWILPMGPFQEKNFLKRLIRFNNARITHSSWSCLWSLSFSFLFGFCKCHIFHCLSRSSEQQVRPQEFQKPGALAWFVPLQFCVSQDSFG